MPSTEEDLSPRIGFLKKEFEVSLAKISYLEKENRELKQEISRLRAQITTLKAHDMERKSMLWKKLQVSMDGKIADRSPQKTAFLADIQGAGQGSAKLSAKEEALEDSAEKERVYHLDLQQPRLLPKSPPKPAPHSRQQVCMNKIQPSAPPPSPPGPPPPPPPPPLPSKSVAGSKAIRRVPGVMEFYRSLMKRDAQKDSKTSSVANQAFVNPKNMIGEIENRSSHLMAIKSDVENHGDFIDRLSMEVEATAFSEISEVVSFVKWLDGELSCLVDERAVLKHFPQWPERKADALREAACNYRNLKNLESEVASFRDNPKQLLTQSLRKMQALQDRLERSVSNMERIREGTSKRYREFRIPWAWMLDTGLVGQLKLSSLGLAKQYMTRIAKELTYSEYSHEGDLLLQGVRFAYRVHQFAGGFDAETLQAFEELRKIGSIPHGQ